MPPTPVRASLGFVVAAIALGVGYIMTTSPLGNVLPSVPPDSLTASLPSWPVFRATSMLGALLGAISQATTPTTTSALALTSSFVQSEVLYSLLQHNVIDSIVPEGSTAVQLAQELDLHAETLRRFLLAADKLGLVKHNRATDLFSLTEVAKAFRSDAPASLRSFALFLNSNSTKAAWRAASARTLVTGESGWALAHDGRELWSHLASNPEESALFDQARLSQLCA